MAVTVKLKIQNKKNPEKPFEIVVVGNKNYGICDIRPRVGEILSDVQGRQINDEDVIYHLENILTQTLNA